MVWDRIRKGVGAAADVAGKAVSEGAGLAGQAGGVLVKTANDAAGVVTAGAQQIGKRVYGGLSDLSSALYSAGENAVTYTITTVDGFQKGITSTAGAAITTLDDGVVSLRRGIADNLRDTKDIAANVGGAAAEVATLGTLAGASLPAFGSGIIIYPLIMGEADKLVKRVADGVADPLCNAIRGGRIEYLDLFVSEADIVGAILGEQACDVHAMIYMPSSKDAGSDGVALVSEEALFYLVRDSNQNDHDRAVFQKALDAVVAEKKKFGIEPASVVLRQNLIAENLAAQNGQNLG